jgi:hypothetical protein
MNDGHDVYKELVPSMIAPVHCSAERRLKGSETPERQLCQFGFLPSTVPWLLRMTMEAKSTLTHGSRVGPMNGREISVGTETECPSIRCLTIAAPLSNLFDNF